MASSENQGLQIALIIFVILTLVLSVTTFLFFRSYQEQAALAEKNAQEAAANQTAVRSALSERDELKRMIGFNENLKLEEMQTEFNNDMAAFAAPFPEDKRHYRDLLPLLQTSITDANKRLAEEQAKVERLNTDLLALQQLADGKVDEFKQAADRATTDYTAAQAEFTKTSGEVAQTREQLLAQMQDLRAKLEVEKQDLLKGKAEQDIQVRKLEGQLKEVIEELAQTKVSAEFEEPDGEIVRVDAVKRTVWINLGSADNLRRQTTFSVHSRDNRRLDQNKARIEVTRVLLDRLSECRILEDSASDPILPGDVIYSPAWKRNREVHFALAGWMDIDRDGRNDIDLVRSLIVNSGGVIDAEMTDSGKVLGEITVRTRYLVLGEQPKVTATEAGQQRANQVLDAYVKMVQDAKRFGVNEINLERFLDLIGWEGGSNLIRFGAMTNPAAFNVRPPDGGYPVSRGSLNEAFKQRRPPKAADAPARESAYDK